MPKFFLLILLLIPFLLSAQTLHKVIVEPCGTDEPRNEIISVTNGATAIDVGDIAIHTLNAGTPTQPDVTFSWSAMGNNTGGDPAAVCPNTNITCLSWLDINTPAEATIINNLINDLNTQAGTCTPTLFVAPTGPNYGSIPPGAQVIFFLGAGGNQSGTVLPGFDVLGTNMDYTSYCGGPPIYAVFGQQPGANSFFGLLSNGNPRPIRVQVGGTTVDSVFSPGTPGGTNPEVLDSAGVFTSGGPCTPTDLFGLTPLDASRLDHRIQEESVLNINALSLFPNPSSAILNVELPVSGPLLIQQRIYSLDGRSTEIRTLELSEGSQELSLDIQLLPAGTYFLELKTELGAFRAPFVKR